MNKKIELIVFTLILFSIILFSVPLILGQEKVWDRAIVSAYGELLGESEPPLGSFTFRVATPPTGSDASNTIILMKYDSVENHTNIILPGDIVVVSYMDLNVNTYTSTSGSETNHYTFYYDGETSNVTVNETPIPEFSPILFAPFFIIASILAIIFKRKHSSKN